MQRQEDGKQAKEKMCTACTNVLLMLQVIWISFSESVIFLLSSTAAGILPKNPNARAFLLHGTKVAQNPNDLQ